MTPMVLLRVAVLVLVPGMACGCAAHYCIGFANDSDVQLRDVEASWVRYGERYSSSAGILAVGADKRNNDEVGPIPARALLSWKTRDGRPHQQVVEVAAKVPNPAFFNGCIWFKFTDQGVDLVPTEDGTAWLPLQHQFRYEP